ncbi:MAG: AbrB family transcriptional regulator [Mobilicoccus sp.]|nr:AbrB family transcriptional regulator [Mobilicoccus sp.]
MSPTRSASPPWWPVLLVATVGALLLAAVGAPSPILFGALFGSLALAVSPVDTPVLPKRLSVLAQGLLGVSIGGIIDPQTLARFAEHALPVSVAVVLTVVVSIVVGQVLRLQGVGRATATFSFLAGGASGVTAIAGELGADDRVVAMVQYLRVLLIIVGMPLVATFVFDVPLLSPQAGLTGVVAGVASAVTSVTAGSLFFSAVCLGVGLAMARVVPLPAGALLLPLAVAAAASVTGVLAPLGDDLGLPSLLEAFAFALIGMQVGLRFTRASLRQVAAVLPLATAGIVVVVALSAGIGIVFADAMGMSHLDAYLATTPGGLWAVLVTATVAGGDVTLVLAVQVVRLLLVLALAPIISAHYRRFRDG